ncbi:hypothetical protein BCR37DRAFT_384146 [Protomyces lactucae-debilis]|uniref:DUF1168 domain protein n=1 Tax=Protomyces lactucae-debilis TaxID=2754530 RepID=A0A1Y2EUZ9_PROLT|nr:uncharacterized protein BCR37DRAFT_384146 [Protomyces lactucae-debilis]ORY75094.1 hypothetical protein BCR37DRAFT_384146 [Protomyces lactucae-debilis]
MSESSQPPRKKQALSPRSQHRQTIEALTAQAQGKGLLTATDTAAPLDDDEEAQRLNPGGYLDPEQAAERARLDALEGVEYGQAGERKSKYIPTTSASVTATQGSIAGAGSGEFHVYKNSRRREASRLAEMEEAHEEAVLDAAFEAKRRKIKEDEERKLEKNRKKREKKKRAGKAMS